MNARCRSCIYRATETTLKNDCDYAIITGRTRTAQVERPSQLLPKNCPFYEKGERQGRLTHINLEDRAATMEQHNRQRLEAFDKAALMAAYREGLNDHEIAERVGTTVNLIAYWRRQNELPRNEGRRKPVSFSEQDFMRLYQDGLLDVEIAKQFGCHKNTVGDFRRQLNLPPNAKVKFDEDELLRLYHEGLSDSEIGRRLAIDHNYISRYRKTHQLAANQYYVKIDHEQFMSLYDDGLNDKQIAEIVGVSKKTVFDYRTKHLLPTKYKAGGKKKCS